MKFKDWLKPGVKIKRWIALSLVGLLGVSLGLSILLKEFFSNLNQVFISMFMIITGIVLMFISIKFIMHTFYNAVSLNGFKINMDSEKLSGLLYEKRILIKGPKIVSIGGGTGSSTMLRGLKSYSSNLTAVVTVSDDGGGSGILREDLGMLPPGDIRNCIMALADTEPTMEKLLQYRFEEGMLKGQSFGNLFLAAMDGISNSFEEAVGKMSNVLAVTGKVLPVSLEDIKLNAKLDDNTTITGESNIGKKRISSKIKKVFLDPFHVKPLVEVIDSIYEADVIILGPGSLYTSIIPNLLVDGVSKAIKNSSALVVYVCNVMTQPGETEGYSVSDHIKAIEKHSLKGIIDVCIVNTASIPVDFKKIYELDGAEFVEIDFDKIERFGIDVVGGDFVSIKNDLIRHNTKKLAENIINIVAERVLSRDKKRLIDYYYVKDMLKSYKE